MQGKVNIGAAVIISLAILGCQTRNVPSVSASEVQFNLVVARIIEEGVRHTRLVEGGGLSLKSGRSQDGYVFVPDCPLLMGAWLLPQKGSSTLYREAVWLSQFDDLLKCEKASVPVGLMPNLVLSFYEWTEPAPPTEAHLLTRSIRPKGIMIIDTRTWGCAIFEQVRGWGKRQIIPVMQRSVLVKAGLSGEE